MLGTAARRATVAAVLLTAQGIAYPGLRLAWTPDELREDMATRLTPEELAAIEVPFEIDDEIRVWARMVTTGVRDDPGKAETIARAIVKDERLRASYDARTTITATEVFRSGRANCISMTNLFIGIVRDMGMMAYYVDVTEATQVRRSQADDVLVAQGHVCAGVRFPHRFVLYDFADRPERTYRGYRILDDREAMATFLLARTLNLALGQGDSKPVQEILETARHDTELALKVKPDFAKAFVNLGAAHARLGRNDDAILLYQRALAESPRLLAAHLALGYVYVQSGRLKEARAAYDRAKDILPDDAYVRYLLGVAEHRDGDHVAARETLAEAVEDDPSLVEGWAALAMVHRALGDEAAAQAALQRASAPR